MSKDRNEGRRLQSATILWNAGEVFITISLGVVAGSLALVAFGLDSLIEVFTSAVVLWHMRAPDTDSRDDSAHRLVGLAFATLATYLMVVSIRALIIGVDPDNSLLGIAYLTLTAGVMLVLAKAKRDIGRRLENPVFMAEARMTQLDAYLAIGILSSLSANALWGWWWADPAAAAAVALLALLEARNNLVAGK